MINSTNFNFAYVSVAFTLDHVSILRNVKTSIVGEESQRSVFADFVSVESKRLHLMLGESNRI